MWRLKPGRGLFSLLLTISRVCRLSGASALIALQAHGHDNATITVCRLVCWSQFDSAFGIFQCDLDLASPNDSEHIKQERGIEAHPQRRAGESCIERFRSLAGI